MTNFNHPPILMAYVAGPYTADTWEETQANIREAEEVGLWLAKHGIYPIIPHANTSRQEFSTLQEYQFWLAATAELMVRAADVVVLTRRWEESGGARGEAVLAAHFGTPIVAMTDDEGLALERIKQVRPQSYIGKALTLLALLKGKGALPV